MPGKVNIVFDDKALDIIDTLQEATGATMAGVIQDALSFYRWAHKEYLEGKAIGSLVEGIPDKEVILPFMKTPE